MFNSTLNSMQNKLSFKDLIFALTEIQSISDLTPAQAKEKLFNNFLPEVLYNRIDEVCKTLGTHPGKNEEIGKNARVKTVTLIAIKLAEKSEFISLFRRLAKMEPATDQSGSKTATKWIHPDVLNSFKNLVENKINELDKNHLQEYSEGPKPIHGNMINSFYKMILIEDPMDNVISALLRDEFSERYEGFSRMIKEKYLTN